MEKHPQCQGGAARSTLLEAGSFCSCVTREWRLIILPYHDGLRLLAAVAGGARIPLQYVYNTVPLVS